MAQWDQEAIDKFFISEAQNADVHLNEIARKVEANRSYERIYDQHLARYYVYNYLQGRSFLVARETLLDELRALTKVRFTTPHDAYDEQRFEEFRQHYIAELIRNFDVNQF